MSFDPAVSKYVEERSVGIYRSKEKGHNTRHQGVRTLRMSIEHVVTGAIYRTRSYEIFVDAGRLAGLGRTQIDICIYGRSALIF